MDNIRDNRLDTRISRVLYNCLMELLTKNSRLPMIWYVLNMQPMQVSRISGPRPKLSK